MISFIIPAYNEEGNILECIASIRAEVGDFPHEIIVVDNNSTDQTADLAELVKVTCITEPTKGVTRARQTGLYAAQYPLAAFIDADNRLPAGWLAHVLWLFKDSGVVAVSGPTIYYELGKFTLIVIKGFYLGAKIFNYVMPTTNGGNCVIKRDQFIEVGGFDTSVEFYGDDTAAARRLHKIGTVKFNLNLFIYGSARRFEAEGILMTGFRYVTNYLWVWVTGHPLNATYHDIRRELPQTKPEVKGCI